MLIQLIKKIKFDYISDRIGPDLPFTHWKLYFNKKMLSFCKKKFKKFSNSAQFRPGLMLLVVQRLKLVIRL